MQLVVQIVGCSARSICYIIIRSGFCSTLSLCSPKRCELSANDSITDRSLKTCLSVNGCWRFHVIGSFSKSILILSINFYRIDVFGLCSLYSNSIGNSIALIKIGVAIQIPYIMVVVCKKCSVILCFRLQITYINFTCLEWRHNHTSNRTVSSRFHIGTEGTFSSKIYSEGLD